MKIGLFVTDLDGTLLGNPESAARFRDAWNGAGAGRPLLCYTTGRLVHDVLELVARNELPRPDYILGGVGTELWDMERGGPVPGFAERLDEGWDFARVDAVMTGVPGVLPQPAEFLHSHKASYFLNAATRDTLSGIEARLREAGVATTVVYSGQRYLDVLPLHADKGKSLAWLARQLGVPASAILVAGDSGNDSSMFRLPDVRGIVVENAQPDLLEAVVGCQVYVALGVFADGVLDGLQHFGVLGRLPARRPRPSTVAVPAMFRPSDLRALSADDVELVREGFTQAVEVLRRNVTPLGFSAASLDDNVTVGTDDNYRAVWARDGAITVIQSLFLDDAEIRQTQLRTLTTLLDHVSPAGQFPSSVHIDTLEPDYSGVGRIASIDGGLWVLIAVYNYVHATGDLALLDRYRKTLERAMAWLGAHDSNADGLLEIPEAGDWTDLFGHSYNVLYDETLWYRANVCHGRLLEFVGDRARAADHFRQAQHIRHEILDSFWPRTRFDASTKAPGFDERQFTLGDTRYLLAQISPFSFSWRCDVWGNILAFLFNILDVSRARTAFEFMWGAGVNDPYPARNLYPPVVSGDPDWRPYFVVNLLNLPGHYHNGGIWPHIGGMWVRFIHRLGLRDIACRELVKLAELNKAGLRSQWEFNEWAHGTTGRPMGKRYQAWSAATYLRACQELEVVLAADDAD
ncbi:MAG TPA: HAD-IIB family hydrolase [Polyangiaceae bacterium]|nr:HAD-IIB family hydrolase [Polyangiaceae bacterium]